MLAGDAQEGHSPSGGGTPPKRFGHGGNGMLMWPLRAHPRSTQSGRASGLAIGGPPRAWPLVCRLAALPAG